MSSAGPSRRTRTAPAAPSETRIAWPTPGPSLVASSSVRAARIGSSTPVVVRPERRAAPVARLASSPRLGVRTSARARIARSRPDAGAGLNTVVAPRSRARRRAARAGPVGISWTTRTTSPGAGSRAPSASRTWASVTAALARARRRSGSRRWRRPGSARPRSPARRAGQRGRCPRPAPISASSASSPNVSTPSAATSATSPRAGRPPRPGCRPCRRGIGRTCRRARSRRARAGARRGRRGRR